MGSLAGDLGMLVPLKTIKVGLFVHNFFLKTVNRDHTTSSLCFICSSMARHQ